MAEKWVTCLCQMLLTLQFCFLGLIYIIPRAAAYLIYTGN